MKSSLETLDAGKKSVWDIKLNQNESKIKFSISAIYDGYLFATSSDSYPLDLTKPESLSNLELK